VCVRVFVCVVCVFACLFCSVCACVGKGLYVKIQYSPPHLHAEIQFNVVTPKYGDTCTAKDSFEEEEAANHFQATHATTCPRPPNTSPTTMLQRSVAELAGAPLSGPPAFHELPEIWTKIASFLGARALGHLACTALRFRAVLSTCVSTSASKALDEVINVYDNVGGHVLLPLLFLREQRYGLGTSEGICTPLHTHTSAEAFRTRFLSPSLSRSFCLTHNYTHTRPTHRHGDIFTCTYRTNLRLWGVCVPFFKGLFCRDMWLFS